jgi:hypothetical protein
MSLRKTLVIAGIVAALTLALPAGQVWAGAETPPTTGTIQGPELWGVVIIDCQSPVYAAVRVKRIQDCAVQIQTLVDPAYSLGCPDNESIPLYHQFTGQSLSFGEGTPIPGTPIITKVKNFKKEQYGTNTYVVTFDAQIKFYLP